MIKIKQRAIKSRYRIKESPVFHVVNYILLTIIGLVCLLPFLNVIAIALSTANLDVNFWPRGFTWFNFSAVFQDANFFRALGISVLVTVLGTALSVLCMYMAAYVLSKPDFPLKKAVMIFFIIVMIFSGGMVPNYIVVNALGLTRTIWSMIFPSVVQVYNLILIKSYLEGLPKELEESAKIDGASNLRIMFKVIMPVSKPCIASVCLFTAVTLWNNYTNALLYLGTEESLYPLSLYILNHIQSSPDPLNWTIFDTQKSNIESAMIIVSILPILIVYPFVLKFFAKGVTVGSVKG